MSQMLKENVGGQSSTHFSISVDYIPTKLKEKKEIDKQSYFVMMVYKFPLRRKLAKQKSKRVYKAYTLFLKHQHLHRKQHEHSSIHLGCHLQPAESYQ